MFILSLVLHPLEFAVIIQINVEFFSLTSVWTEVNGKFHKSGWIMMNEILYVSSCQYVCERENIFVFFQVTKVS